MIESTVPAAGPARRPLTLLEVIATVSHLTTDEEETADVINHMLEAEVISFQNEAAPEEIKRLLQ
jgi:hypothetical protein